MEESIVKLIAEAEQAASARKAQAQAEAAEIVAEAERRAAEIGKASEDGCRRYLEEQRRLAEQQAATAYDSAIEQSRTEAVRYAEGLLEHAELYVYEIVGRLTK